MFVDSYRGTGVVDILIQLCVPKVLIFVINLKKLRSFFFKIYLVTNIFQTLQRVQLY